MNSILGSVKNMISTKNLLLNINSSSQLNSGKSVTSSADSLKMLGENETKEDLEHTDEIDLSTFVLLLNQTFSNIPDQNAAPSQSGLQNTLIKDLSFTNNAQTSSVNTLLPEAQPVSDSNLQNITSLSEHDNPALNWIDSESYQSFAAKPAETNLVLTQQNKGLAELSPKIQTDAEAAPTIDPVQVDKIKNEVAHSLQQLSSAIMSNNIPTDSVVKSDTLAQNLGSTVQNTQAQPVLPQAGHAQSQKTLDIPLPLNHAQWGDKFAEHIVWLGNNDIKSAVIKINPEELGPLEISVKVVKDSANVNILSHSMHVRDIVDQAIPRLRDMMADQGLNLANVQVSADTRSNNQFAQNNNNNDPHYEASFNEAEEEAQLVTSIKKPPKGLVDYFA